MPEVLTLAECHKVIDDLDRRVAERIAEGLTLPDADFDRAVEALNRLSGRHSLEAKMSTRLTAINYNGFRIYREVNDA